jgi:hypothetical protein
MIRTVADVAITEVTIWQQCVITSRDKKEEKMKNTRSLNICLYYSILSVVFIYNCFRKFSLLIFKNWFKFVFVE